MKKLIIPLILLIVLSSSAMSQKNSNIMSLKKQAELMNNWLEKRLDTVLPAIMKREGIDMWIVMCREYNEDPVYLTLMPKPIFAARRLSILMFYTKPDGTFERLTVAKGDVGNFYKGVWKKEIKTQWVALANAISERNPAKIGLNFSEEFAFGDGITSNLKEKFIQAIDKKFKDRIVSAENIAVGWLETRIPEEMKIYPQIVFIAHEIIAEAFSNKVITPGTTTNEDVEWWIRDKIQELGLTTWFPPSIDIIRESNSSYKNSQVIQRGDMLHCDVGIIYLGLNTDTQQLAYILKEGENDVPAGLKKGLAEGNRLQDIVMGEMKTGLSGNQILKNSLEKAKGEGLTPSVYCHPLGYHGHGAGPLFGLWDNQSAVPGRGDYRLYSNTCYSIELNVMARVPEWNNQQVQFALEQDAFFDGTKTVFLDIRQKEFYLVK